MRHVYECPLRWADLDLLGHVNNVVYVDYLQEARVDLFRTHAPDQRADDLVEGVVVVRHEVDYVSSLMFRFAPVRIECWVSQIRAASFTMRYEIFDEDDEGNRTVYLRASTVLTPYVFTHERPRRLQPDEISALERILEPHEPVRADAASGVPESASTYDVHVRFSDVDVYGHVNNVKYFEYFQEARIAMTRGIVGPDEGVHLVIARSEVDYKVPILFRPEPYEVRTWVSKIGRTSLTIEAVILDGDQVMSRARVVGVVIDSATGTPTPVPAGVRAVLMS